MVHRDEVLARVNLRRVRQVVLIGRVGMSTPFLQKALRRGIGIVLTDDHGEFIGRFESMERGTPGYRLDQAKAARSSSAALKIARGFVLGKLQNQRVMLLRLDRRMAEPILGPYIRRIDRSRVDAMGADQLAVLRGIEGAGARDYFAAFGDFLAPEWGWKGRVRRPPTDPVNAMLSFAYTLLTNEGVTAAEAAGLDPYVGFLHEAHVGRPSLALDLIEEFRPILVDSVVFSLLGRSQVTTSDFDLVPDGPCRMTRDARDALITAYERRMLRV
ncbi:MAG: hypothetical protein QG597_3821, partial [Actinomycetota bacterium]|nr:hypothetical protein [Actinomycetota bacterium]